MVAPLVLLAGLGLTACSGPPLAPPRQPAVVETSVSTRHYPVRGTTTTAIFTAIDANGLVEARSGQRASAPGNACADLAGATETRRDDDGSSINL